MKPLCVDLYAGLGGWTDGFLAEGYDCIGFDIERHVYGDQKYPAQLVLQDVLTLDGAQFRNAACIVASPPCQEFSYAAMPWKRSKAEVPEVLPPWWDKSEPDMDTREMAQWREWRSQHPAKPPSTELFDACFRIQTEASESAGHHIPLIVENVKGAQPWVGRAKAHYGSFYLWGDIPALMPSTRQQKIIGYSDPRRNGGRTAHITSQRENALRGICICPPECDCQNPEPESGVALVSNACPIHNMRPEIAQDCPAEVHRNGAWEDQPCKPPGQTETGRNPVNGEGTKQHGSGAAGFDKALDERRRQATATKNGNDWFGSGENCSRQRRASSTSSARKAASAAIARIPLALSRWIAKCYFPESRT
jgi:hypothetical protein